MSAERVDGFVWRGFQVDCQNRRTLEDFGQANGGIGLREEGGRPHADAAQDAQQREERCAGN